MNLEDQAKHKLILIDDDPDVRQVFSMIFSTQGFDVVHFDNQDDAKDYLSNNPLPDVAVIDINLGNEGNGLELGTWIRSRPNGSKMVMATLTGMDTESCREQALSAGFDFHFGKPVKMVNVCRKLKEKLAQQDQATTEST